MKHITNVANILVNKPEGTKLYDKARGVVVSLDNISTINGEIIIRCQNEEDNFFYYQYTEFGTLREAPNEEIALVPSEDIQEWSECQRDVESKVHFHNGDTVYIESEYGINVVAVFKSFAWKLRPTVYCYLFLDEEEAHITDSHMETPLCNWNDIKVMRLATETEKQQLFDTLIKQGKRWNAEAKCIEG